MLLNLDFLAGSKENYEALEKEKGVFYLVDDKKIYLGDILLNKTEISIGSDPPEDEEAQIWIDPSGEAITIPYALTEEDKQEIAQIAVSLFPIYNGEVVEE